MVKSRDSVEFSRKNTFRVYKTVSKRKITCIRSNKEVVMIDLLYYWLFFAPTRNLGGFIQLFAALQEHLLGVSQTNKGPRLAFYHETARESNSLSVILASFQTQQGCFELAVYNTAAHVRRPSPFID